MSIDEAHYYFPQVGAREDFNKKTAETVNHWGRWAQSPPPTTPPWQSNSTNRHEELTQGA